VLISDLHTWSTSQAIPLAPKGTGSIELDVDYLNLMPGTYYLSVWASSLHEWHDQLDNVATLELEPSDYYGTGRGIEARFGLVFFPFRWTLLGSGPCKNDHVSDQTVTAANSGQDSFPPMSQDRQTSNERTDAVK
jgi:hypothetical protein